MSCIRVCINITCILLANYMIYLGNPFTSFFIHIITFVSSSVYRFKEILIIVLYQVFNPLQVCLFFNPINFDSIIGQISVVLVQFTLKKNKKNLVGWHKNRNSIFVIVIFNWYTEFWFYFYFIRIFMSRFLNLIYLYYYFFLT